MIVFNFICGNDHRFEGWFASTNDFERQQKSALLNCPICGTREVAKTMHAPHVSIGGDPQRERPSKTMLQQCANVDAELARLVEYVIANTEDVGEAFPEEVRKIHYQEVPERKIRGHASSEEVSELQDEGIEIMVLPDHTPRFGKPH